MFGKKTNTTATPATTTTTATVTPATTTKKANPITKLAPAFGAGFVGGIVAIGAIRVTKKITHMITSKIGSGDPEPNPEPNPNPNPEPDFEEEEEEEGEAE